MIWIANDGELVTDMAEITDSTRTEVLVQFAVHITCYQRSYSRVRDSSLLTHGYCVYFASDLDRNIFTPVQVDRLSMISLINDNSCIVLVVFLSEEAFRGLSTPMPTHTMAHLLPSSASFGGFLPARDVGLLGLRGFFIGLGGAARTLELAGTGPDKRMLVFLWVCCSGFTLRSPAVIASPLLSSAKTAAGPATGAEEAAGPLSATIEGGGGGGGGGGGPPEAVAGAVDFAEPMGDCHLRASPP